MSSKLIKPAQFNRPVPAVVQLPYPQEQIACTLTVIILKNKQVDLYGTIHNQELAQQILASGRARLDQWHAQQKAAREALLVGPDGQPITGQAGTA